ncbi:unnamed protein product [Clavelina lepadiformis]|uniref:Helicase ATP-binding domain-containing protein n=1 Tax=Clavelina lepadiformis TaxID=159417 RepID=A0ABP0GZZ3_CLALP
MPRVKVTPRTRILSSESDLSDFVDTPSQKYQSKCKARKSSVSEPSTSSDAGCNDIAKKKELRIHLKKIDIKEKVEVDKQDKSDQDSDEYILKRKSKRKYKNDHWENTISSEDESDEESSLFEEELTTTNRKRTKRVQRTGDNSDGSESAESSTEISSRDEEEEDTDNTRRRQTRQAAKRRKATRKGKQEKKKNSGRKAIRHVLAADELNEETKVAEKEEEERRKRLEERGDNKIVEVDVDEHSSLPSQPITKRLVLQKDPLVEVHPFITVNLKPHQVEGIQFIWDNLVESTKCAEKGDGGGCILAHCMGLGKTLQTISATHTILTSDHLSLLTVLVVAPLNTLLNWIDEYSRWMPDDQPLQLYNLAQYQTTRHRIDALKKWRDRGGVMVMGYDMFRLLATGTRIKHKPHKKKLEEFLLDPGPDIIVCDEGHKLKNSEAHISKIMGKIKTKRRLILTGTPLQNNLAEYQCMVNFVKPNLLGTLKEFRNRFVNPIQNGQHSDSTYHDVRIMKKRCHVLHEMLRGFVQRKDYTALAQYLCDKHEYIIKVRQTALQIKLYQHYLDTLTNRGNNPHAVVQGNRDTGLFADYQNLMRIWTHPRVLKMHTDKKAAEMKNFMTSSEEEDEALSTEEEGEEKGNFEENASKKVGLTTIKEGETHVNGHELKALYSDDDDDGDFDITERTQISRRKRRKRIQDSDDEPSEESSLSTSSSSDEEGDSEERKDDSLKFRRRTRAGRYRLRGGNSDSSDGGETSDVEMNGLDKEEQQKDDEAWYSSLIKEDDFLAQDAGGKITVLFEILRLANECDDKVAVQMISAMIHHSQTSQHDEVHLIRHLIAPILSQCDHLWSPNISGLIKFCQYVISLDQGNSLEVPFQWLGLS